MTPWNEVLALLRHQTDFRDKAWGVGRLLESAQSDALARADALFLPPGRMGILEDLHTKMQQAQSTRDEAEQRKLTDALDTFLDSEMDTEAKRAERRNGMEDDMMDRNDKDTNSKRSLRAQIAEVQAEVAELRAEVTALRAQRDDTAADAPECEACGSKQTRWVRRESDAAAWFADQFVLHPNLDHRSALVLPPRGGDASRFFRESWRDAGDASKRSDDAAAWFTEQYN